jgi:cell wall-associated NlpC family hydrolase
MSDPRTTPAAQTQETPARITIPVADLTRTPNGARDRQLLMGDPVTILHDVGQHRLVRAERDGYHGYVEARHLGPPQTPSYHVTARSTHAYSAPDIKSAETMTLSFGSRLAVRREHASFIETEFGFIPRQHVHPMDAHATDPAAVAHVFLGTPYLWGGNSGFGIDCSGLVQAALHACFLPCPGDSDQQEARLGAALPSDAPFDRNDLVFWRGHVAIVTDSNMLIHANAGHMAVATEAIDTAIARIEAQGDGPPTAHKRLSLSFGRN